MRGLVISNLLSRWRSVAALAFGCFLLLVVLAGTYSAYGGAAGFAKSFGAKPPQLLSAFSGSSSADIFSPVNFLAFGFNHPMFLVLALSVAVTTGVAAVASEVETGRAELLFTAPVPRSLVLTARVVEWVVAETFVVGWAVVGAAVGSRLSGDLSQVSALVPLRIGLQFSSLAFFTAAIAFAASSRAPSRGVAFAATVGVTAGSYVVNLVALLWSPIAFVRWLNPFGYYAPTDAAAAVNWPDMAVLYGGGIVLFALAYHWLSSRDLA